MKLKILNVLILLFLTIKVEAGSFCSKKENTFKVVCDFEAKRTDENAKLLSDYLDFEVTIEDTSVETDEDKEKYKIFSTLGSLCKPIVSSGKTTIYNIPTVEKRDKICDLLEKD